MCALAVASFLAPHPLFAEAGWTRYAHVLELTATSQYRYFVTLKEAANPSGCRNKGVYYQDHNAPGAEDMLRVLLAAVATGKRVRLYVTGNCDINGYSEISSVSITP